MTLTAVRPDLKERVLEILQHHMGRENAYKMGDLAEELGISDRLLQNIVRQLRREHQPILASTQKPYGYYMPASWAEVIEFAGSMRSRVIEDCLTRRDVLRGAPAYFENAKERRLL